MPEMSPAAQVLARRVLRHEAGGRAEPAALAEAAERADARLRERLASLIGQTGYTTLVARAVYLAQAEVPALEHVTVDALATGGDPAEGGEGGLHGVREFARGVGDAGAAEAGLSAILAHVIGLLVTFIGEDLALRLVRDAWPELPDGQGGSEG
jgi:hypothetical protein